MCWREPSNFNYSRVHVDVSSDRLYTHLHAHTHSHTANYCAAVLSSTATSFWSILVLAAVLAAKLTALNLESHERREIFTQNPSQQCLSSGIGFFFSLMEILKLSFTNANKCILRQKQRKKQKAKTKENYLEFIEDQSWKRLKSEVCV